MRFMENFTAPNAITLSSVMMTDTEKLDYILITLQSLQSIIPKDSDDDKLHQLSARIKVAVSFTKALLYDE